MSEVNIDISESPFPQSPVVPEMHNGSYAIQFRCHKQIACFNACCKNIDISLTPYDIIRLKQRLALNSSEFLQTYTFPYEIEKDSIAGVKLKPLEGGTACQFMTEQGCSVYEDRPTACRYYPVALLSMRKQDEYTDSNAYALVKEAHCQGHAEPRSLSIDEYRQEQGLVEYDEQARGWRQLILKKKSSGPYIGKPSARSRQLFFTACYDLDRFRAFVASEGFLNSFDLPQEEMLEILQDDIALMQFGFRLLRQVLFGEQTIPVREEALEQRLQRAAERKAAEPPPKPQTEEDFEDPYTSCSS